MIMIEIVLRMLFGTNSWLATFLISMFPLVELKGGIPIGMSVDFWGENALNGMSAFLWALCGSSAVVFILPLIFKPLLNFLKRIRVFKKLAELIEGKITHHASNINSKKKSTLLKCLTIFLFVAIPIPLTGVWTGACVAVAIGLDYWQSVFSVFFGNIIAGTIIYFVCSAMPYLTTLLVYVVLGIILLSILITSIKIIVKKKKTIKE